MRALAAIAMLTVALLGAPGTTPLAAANADDKPQAAEEGPRPPTTRPSPKAEVVPDVTILQGSLSPDEVRKVIQKSLPRFRRCYQRGLDGNPKLKGRIDVHFSIGTKGVVLEAGVRTTTMNDEKVEACVVKTMRGLKFPRPRGGVVTVSYPFVFGAA